MLFPGALFPCGAGAQSWLSQFCAGVVRALWLTIFAGLAGDGRRGGEEGHELHHRWLGKESGRLSGGLFEL